MPLARDSARAPPALAEEAPKRHPLKTTEKKMQGKEAALERADLAPPSERPTQGQRQKSERQPERPQAARPQQRSQYRETELQ